jgi:autotransporter translocation and assembly factor TamB
MKYIVTLVSMLLWMNVSTAADPPVANVSCPPTVNLKFTPVEAYTVSGVTVSNRPFGQSENRPVRQATTRPIVVRTVDGPNMSSTVPVRSGVLTPTVAMPMVRYGIIRSGSG